MKTTRHLILYILLSFLIIFIGTTGYMIIEGWDAFDALYMTVITLATVGYGEVHKVSRLGQLFTILLILLGGGFCLYVAGALVQFMVEGRIREILGRKRLDNKINRLKNHYILCGYGRIGQVLCKNLKDKIKKIVVIDNNPDLVPVMNEDNILYILGDASDEAVLFKAGIKHAKVLIAALATDTDNVFLVLTARQMNPDIFIMARASQEASKAKLQAAGANKVESPYVIGAANMAQRIIRPTVTNFLELAFEYDRKDIQMEEISISPSSRLINVKLMNSGIRQKYNLIIIAIKKPDGNMLFNPSHDTIIQSGDTLIAVGEENNLLKLEKVLSSQ